MPNLIKITNGGNYTSHENKSKIFWKVSFIPKIQIVFSHKFKPVFRL